MKTKHLFWIIPVAIIWISLMVLSFSNDDEKQEKPSKKEHHLMGVSLNSDTFQNMGSYDVIPCSNWPRKFEVGTFKNEPLSFVIDLEKDKIVHVDSTENSACAYTSEEYYHRINSMFSESMGHMAFTRYIKDNMNDPASFEHLETKYKAYPDTGQKKHVFVYTRFRGTNAAGNDIIGEIGAKIDLNNNIEEVFQGQKLANEMDQFQKMDDQI
ncbi:MAG: hypothetical protein ACOC2E_06230 [Bacteroidota bacterium]